jgi:hypothetical protein
MLQKADEAPLPVESQVERIQAMIAARLGRSGLSRLRASS